ncbi:hypothetical protein Bwad002_12380 [Bilophila wadsworthia]
MRQCWQEAETYGEGHHYDPGKFHFFKAFDAVSDSYYRHDVNAGAYDKKKLPGNPGKQPEGSRRGFGDRSCHEVDEYMEAHQKKQAEQSEP